MKSYFFLTLTIYFIFLNAGMAQHQSIPSLNGKVFKISQKEIIIDPSGDSTMELKKYLLDTLGNQIWGFEYKKAMTRIFSRDSLGNKKSTLTKDKSMSRVSSSKSIYHKKDSTIIFIYNDYGKIIKQYKYYYPNDSSTIFQLFEYNEYDDGPQLILEDTTIMQSKKKSIQYNRQGITQVFKEYDEKGNITDQNNVNLSGDTLFAVSYDYQTFDDKGNWLKMKVQFDYGDYIFYKMLERTYTYYSEGNFESIYKIETVDLKYDQIAEDNFHDDYPGFFSDTRYLDENYFYNFGRLPKYGNERIYNFSYTFVINNKTHCSYKISGKRESWFKSCHFYRGYEQHGIKATPTGKKVNVNGIPCQEYIIQHDNKIEGHYYIDPTRAFVNYGEFWTKFPGFVVKSKRNYQGGFIEWTVGLKKVAYPLEYIVAIDSFKKQE